MAFAAGGIAPINCQTTGVLFAPCENGVLGDSIGATGTGVIDENDSDYPGHPILYLAAVVDISGIPTYFLYAVDTVEGTVLQTEQIMGSFAGQNPQQDNICTSDYPNNTGLTFNYNHIQRAGLLLGPNGWIYVAFSPGDSEWENGWLFAYSFASSTFTQKATLVTTPYGTGGGIWGSGAGPATDDTYIYTVTANGTWDMVAGNSIPVDMASSVLKLLPNGNQTFSVMDYYTPTDVNNYVPPEGSKYTGRCLNDTDLGSGGLMIFPDRFYTPPGQQQPLTLAVVADKESNIYVVNTNNLGQFAAGGTTNFEGNNVETVPTLPLTDDLQGYWGSGAYWRHSSGGTTNYYLYYAATTSTTSATPYPIFQYILNTNPNLGGPILTTTGYYQKTTTLFCRYSPTPSVSSDGNTAGSGILWAIENQNGDNPGNPTSCADTTDHLPAALHAYDAASLGELYNSGKSVTTKIGQATYPTPTIFQGRVYIGTWTEVDVFGQCSTGPNQRCMP